MYEYKNVFILDNYRQIDEVMNSHARDGWRVLSTIMSSIGIYNDGPTLMTAAKACVKIVKIGFRLKGLV